MLPPISFRFSNLGTESTTSALCVGKVIWEVLNNLPVIFYAWSITKCFHNKTRPIIFLIQIGTF